MGSSWTTLFTRYGYSVNLYDIDAVSLANAEKKVKENYDVLMEFDLIDEESANKAMSQIRYCTELQEALNDVDLIQECILDKLEPKRALLKEIDKYNSKAIFCSSTSFLRITDIAKESNYAERCIGAHPYNPPHLMPLVELTKGEKTDEFYIKKAYDFYKGMKKEPVVLLKEAVGFIGNRLQTAYLREAVDIVSQGICSVEDLDKASVFGLGLRWAILGPNLNGELNGGDGGIKDYFGPKYINGFNDTLKENARWTKFPDDYGQKLGYEGVESEKRNRDPETGNTREEIIEYRQKLLVEILKLHKKI
nr:3-hydroxyacyl-CoA dehydrogenase NAD-binding domain-containing protein [Sedimentibacter sp.]